jgi:hypothetical protein
MANTIYDTLLVLLFRLYVVQDSISEYNFLFGEKVPTVSGTSLASTASIADTALLFALGPDSRPDTCPLFLL